MKRFTLIVCFSLLLLLIAAAPVCAVGADRIDSITPSGGATDQLVEVTIVGFNFSNSSYPGSVRLKKSGKNDIVGTAFSKWSTTEIICKFSIPKNAKTGKWNLVVEKGASLGEVVQEEYFTVTDPMTLTSISPTSGRADDDDVDFTIKGKGFVEDKINDVYLLNSDDEKISADDFDWKSETEITGTFDLEGEEVGDYDVCVKDDYGAIECDLDFEILTDAEGDLEVSSSPSGATIYLDNVANGTTPNTIKDLPVGSYKIVLKKSGYEDWGKVVTVEEDETYEVDAKLYAIATATPRTTTEAPQTTAPRTTTRTPAKSTIKVPTTYAEVPTTAEQSPLGPVFIIGAIGLAFIALRKN